MFIQKSDYFQNFGESRRKSRDLGPLIKNSKRKKAFVGTNFLFYNFFYIFFIFKGLIYKNKNLKKF